MTTQPKKEQEKTTTTTKKTGKNISEIWRKMYQISFQILSGL